MIKVAGGWWRAVALAGCLLMSAGAQAFEAPVKAEPPVAVGEVPVLFSTFALAKSRLSPSEVAILHLGSNKLAARFPIDEPRLKSHFPLGWGFLNVARLEPGQYRLALYADEPYYDYHPASQDIRFEVQAGQPVYIGELQFELENGVGRLRVNDQSGRDLPLFARKNPGLSAVVFRKQLAQPAGAPAKP